MIRSRAPLALALLLALLFPALLLAQDGWGFDRAQGTRGGFGPAQGTGAAVEEEPSWTPATATDAVAAYDPGDTSTLIKGGYDLVPADDDYFARTSGAIPLVSGGVPQYPISVVCWFKTDTTAGADRIVEFSDGTTNDRLLLYRNGATLNAFASSDGVESGSATSAAAVTAGRWHCAVAVFASTTSRAIYLDTDTTGATNATAVGVDSISNLYVGRDPTVTAEFDGVIAHTALLPVDLSGAGNATIRQNIFNGADPEAASSTTATAVWKFDNDAGADSRGDFDLTASGTPTAQNNLIVMRDLVGTYHMRASTSAPTYDATLFSNRGGITFTAASSQFLRCDSTPITAAPFQIYSVATSADVTTQRSVFTLSDTGVSNEYWSLVFGGATANDPVQWVAADSGSFGVAATSAGYSANTTHLLWGMETSTTSRAVRLDGANEGTNTDSRNPTSADRMAIGCLFSAGTASSFVNGSVGLVLVLNSADVSERSDVHTYVNNEFSTSIP